MRRGFYAKMAVMNIRKNGKMFVPYILTCIGCVAMFYIIHALSLNSGLEHTVGASALMPMLSFGALVVGLFSVIFLFYTNSFLAKRRKKEFGLYNILGMEKKHIAKVMFLETVFVSIFSLVVGIATGILLNKLCVLLILNLVDLDTVLGFEISVPAMITAAILYLCIFFFNFLNGLRQIHKAKPIDLLKGGQVGEREPKTKWILAILGVLLLGGGYYVSLSTKDPISALGNFFLAVLLVILGTYCLFTAGSIAILKGLRKNKGYYYKTKHFISIAGMIYRMKRNAVGLANICIFSTVVLVTLSATTSMYIGVADVMDAQYPRDIIVTSYDWENGEALKTQIQDSLDRERANEVFYTYLSFSGLENNGEIITDRDGSAAQGADVLMGNLRTLYFIPLEDYNRFSGEQETLQKGEIIIYSTRMAYEEKTMKLFGMEFRVKEQLDEFSGDMGFDAANLVNSHYIIVDSVETLKLLEAEQKAAYGDDSSQITYVYGFDLNLEDDEKMQVADALQGRISKEKLEDVTIRCKAEQRIGLYSLFGGMFFVGIFIGLLFIMATVLIIYYKQISEGYDDKERFEIMQKVGMSKGEVKKTIHSQVLTVFFLPLVFAGVHVAFAFPVLTKLLSALSLNNTELFIWCTLICFAVFALFYAAIYALTARSYYKIVSAK